MHCHTVCYAATLDSGNQPVDVDHFLKSYANPDAYVNRLKAGWGPEYVAIRDAVFEPLAMALGIPEDPWPPAWP